MGENSLFLEAAAVEKLLQRGEGGVPARSRGRRLANTNPSPRVAGPDSVGASGTREVTKREMDVPKIDKSVMLGRVADEDSSLQRNGGEGQREEKLAKPEVRDDK